MKKLSQCLFWWWSSFVQPIERKKVLHFNIHFKLIIYFSVLVSTLHSSRGTGTFLPFWGRIQRWNTRAVHYKYIWDLFEWKVLSGERAMSSEKSPSCSGPLSLTAVGRPWNWITPSLSIMQIDPAHGGRAEQSASCWFCGQPSILVNPLSAPSMWVQPEKEAKVVYST